MPRTLSDATYSLLNSKQKEIYNFQIVSAKFAELGFATYRLVDDWNSADFFAVPFNGEPPLKVQLKTRVIINKKYMNKEVFICFRHKNCWYLFPHDELYEYTMKNKNVPNAKSFAGVWSWPYPPIWLLGWLQKYELKAGWTS